VSGADVQPGAPPAPAQDIPCSIPFDALPRAYGEPVARAAIRTRPEDFRVEERLGYEPEGPGQHVWLRVRKRELDTEAVARRIARAAGVAVRDVGFAGLKDRRAVATQWFSVDLGGRAEPHWGCLEDERLRVLATQRGRRKLRRGALAANRFEVRLRAPGGGTMNCDMNALAACLAAVEEGGVPNYFGPQRFGRDAGNVARAYAMLQGSAVRDRHRRGLYLSTARALLFNRVLARRVAEGSWNQALEGEAVMLEGTRSLFAADPHDSRLPARLQALDVHPTGPLWGRGEPALAGEARALEERVLAPCATWRRGLEQGGVRQARRALRARVRELGWEAAPDGVILRFTLPPGAYATAALRELVSGVTSSAGSGLELEHLQPGRW